MFSSFTITFLFINYFLHLFYILMVPLLLSSGSPSTPINPSPVSVQEGAGLCLYHNKGGLRLTQSTRDPQAGDLCCVWQVYQLLILPAQFRPWNGAPAGKCQTDMAKCLVLSLLMLERLSFFSSFLLPQRSVNLFWEPKQTNMKKIYVISSHKRMGIIKGRRNGFGMLLSFCPCSSHDHL